MNDDFENEEDYLHYLDSLSLEQILQYEEADDAEIHVAIGRKYNQQRKYTDAARHFQRALEMDPKNAWHHLYFGNLYFAWGKNAEAKRYFQKAIELAPDLACPYWCLGDVYATTLDDALATKMYEKAVFIQPEDAQAQRRLKHWTSQHRN